jgi:hypothetical protein
MQQESLANMIEQHEQNDQAAQCVDRLQSRGSQRLQKLGRHRKTHGEGLVQKRLV